MHLIMYMYTYSTYTVVHLCNDTPSMRRFALPYTTFFSFTDGFFIITHYIKTTPRVTRHMTAKFGGRRGAFSLYANGYTVVQCIAVMLKAIQCTKIGNQINVTGRVGKKTSQHKNR